MGSIPISRTMRASRGEMVYHCCDTLCHVVTPPTLLDKQTNNRCEQYKCKQVRVVLVVVVYLVGPMSVRHLPLNHWTLTTRGDSNRITWSCL